MQLFANPETGALNRIALTGFLQRMKEDANSEQKKYWLYIEDMIYKQRLSSKFTTLIRQGLYVTKLETDRRQEEISTSVDLSYLQKLYSSVADNKVTINESDVKTYYKQHKIEYKQEESRSIKYVSFDVVPSESDNAYVKKWIEDILPEFTKITDVEQYVKFNSDKPYDRINFKKGELPERLDAFMFNAKIGDVYGPYFEENTYKIAKLAKINYLPDSIHVKQILLPVNQNNVNQMQYLADSLKNLAQSGYDFAELVRNNSKDASSQSGGDIGWIREGTYSPRFSDSCFSAGINDIKITFSKAGIHIIKVIEKSTPVKKVQVGILAREVRASDQTDQYYYSKASEFAGLNNTVQKFEAAIKSNQPAAIPVFDLKPLDNSIQGLEKPRQLIRWVFEANEGDVSKVYRFGDKYVIAAITKVNKKGYKSLNEVAASITLEVRKEKKAEMLIKEMAIATEGQSSIDAIATKLNTNVKSVTGIRFTSYSLQDAGAEPKVIAAAMSIEPNKVSEPVAGENGVYIIDVNNRIKAENQNFNPTLIRNYIERSYSARVNYQTFEVLQELANINDNRGRFY
jgi:peptidyl-prolyl cis-trans isomerase D